MIRNLLFDLGGVIMDIERDRCVAEFEKLGMADADSMLGVYGQQGLFAALESGAVTAAEWRDGIRRKIGRAIDDKVIDDAFEAFLIGIPRHRLEELRRLRKKYRVYMLSNTNQVMWNSKIAQEFRQEGLEREDYFDGMVTSFEARVMKPSAGIFEYAEKTLGISPAETVFLDDSAENCRAAEALGWNTCVVKPGSEFVDILESKGLITD